MKTILIVLACACAALAHPPLDLGLSAGYGSYGQESYGAGATGYGAGGYVAGGATGSAQLGGHRRKYERYENAEDSGIQSSITGSQYGVGAQQSGGYGAYQGGAYQGGAYQGSGYQGSGYQGSGYQGQGYLGGAGALRPVPYAGSLLQRGVGGLNGGLAGAGLI